MSTTDQIASGEPGNIDPAPLRQNRWLAAFYLKTALRLETDDKILTGQYAGVEVFLQNVKREHGESYRLDLKFILFSSDMEAAQLLAETTAAEISHTLNFVSAASVRVERPIFLIDWEPGLEQRDQFVYGEHPFVDPMDSLDEIMWRTVQVVSEHEATSAKRAALRWYTRGTRAEVLEDQFLYHFFAIEILAAAETFTGKVVDKCPRCKGELACPNPDCGQPEHRPFPKQKIAMLLKKIGLSDRLIEGLTELGNLLSHGEERPEVIAHMKKASPEFELEKAVWIIAEASTDALHRALDLPEQDPPLTFDFRETPEHVTIKSRSRMRIGLKGNPHNLKIEEVWMPELSVVITDPKTGEKELVFAGGTPAKRTDSTQQ